MNWDLLSLLKQLVEKNQVNISNESLESGFNSTSASNQKQNAVYSVIDRLVRASGDTSIGLKVGKLITPNSFYGLGYLFMTADNLLTACQRMCEFPYFYQNIISLNTEYDDRSFVLNVTNNSKHSLTQAIINEASLGVFYQYMKWLSRDDFVDCEVYLSHNPVSHSSVYQKYFHRQPQFDHAHTHLRFPISIAKAPLLTSEPEYHLALYSKLKEKHVNLSQSFLSRAQVAIRNSLKLGNISRPDIAKQLSLSEKTLERRLEKSNLSFRKLTQGIRRELAVKYLVQTNLSMDEIARCLGYSDRNTFSKAFKNWTGITPGQQRGLLEKLKTY